jgi:hypothetical protein
MGIILLIMHSMLIQNKKSRMRNVKVPGKQYTKYLAFV